MVRLMRRPPLWSRGLCKLLRQQAILLVCLASLALDIYEQVDVRKHDWVTESYQQQVMQGPTVLSSDYQSQQENNGGNDTHDVFCQNATRMSDLCHSTVLSSDYQSQQENNGGNDTHDVFCQNATRMSDLCQSDFGSDFLWQWLPRKRADRFPSVEDRIKLYMGNWYLPPCTGSSNISDGTDDETTDERLVFDWDYSKNDTFPDLRLQFRSETKRNQPTLVNLTLPTTNALINDPQVLWNEALWSANDGTQRCFHSGRIYCNDMRRMTSIAQQITGATHLSQLEPIIGQMGDNMFLKTMGDYPMPVFIKVRYASTKTDLRDVTTDSPHRCTNPIGSSRRGLVIPARHLKTPRHSMRYQPIIMPFTLDRHFKYSILRAVSTDDVPWENKKDAAVWRGTMTNGKPIFKTPNLTFRDICNSNRRCTLVEPHWNSSLVDVGITRTAPGDKKHFENIDVPKYIFKKGLSITDQLGYKALISIEGNDVATGLKWQLLSNSVVIMPVPTRTSYAMEEALEPWVHFVPIEREDMSDLEDKVQWVLEHDREARTIAERGKLFIADLVFHEDSAKDNDEIYVEILKRYFQFFKHTINPLPNPPHRTPLQQSPLPSLREKFGVNDQNAKDREKLLRIMFTHEQ